MSNSTLPSTTETRTFQMFALEYLRLDREQRETVIDELTEYAEAYSVMINGGKGCGEFRSEIMSISFDRYISDCYLEDIAEIIRDFMIRYTVKLVERP
jgi:hypothetical protein